MNWLDFLKALSLASGGDVRKGSPHAPREGKTPAKHDHGGYCPCMLRESSVPHAEREDYE